MRKGASRTEFHKGYVYISKKHINKIFELLEEDNEEAIEEYLAQEKAERHSAKDFMPSFIHDLESDLKILHRVRSLWEKIHRDPKWEAFRDILKSDPKLKKGKLIIFTESKETAEYLSERIRKEVDPKVILFSGEGDEATHRAVISNFDANAFRPQDDYRILVSTEVLSEGVNLHRSNTVVNYDIPWNPTRLIQRVGRVNRVDTKFDTIETYTFFPTQEGNDLIKLREAAEAKIHAFIEMLGADARLLTEGEEVKSHDLFVRLTSRKVITGEDEEEDSELEFLTEIRAVRDKNPDLFARIKRLPKKARSSKESAPASCEQATHFPALITYFRQGRLDKFYVANESGGGANELDFFSTARILTPSDVSEKRPPVPKEFYSLLDVNKKAFSAATGFEMDDSIPHQKGGANDVYILKRLKAREIRKYQGFTEEDESFIDQTIQLLDDGALPRPTTKKVAEALKKEIEPLKVLGILRRGVPTAFFQSARAQLNPYAHSPQEVILSSYLVEAP